MRKDPDQPMPESDFNFLAPTLAGRNRSLSVCGCAVRSRLNTAYESPASFFALSSGPKKSKRKDYCTYCRFEVTGKIAE